MVQKVKEIIKKVVAIIWTAEVKRSLIRGARILVFGTAVAVVAEIAKLPAVETSVIGTALVAVVDKFVRDQVTK